MWCPSKRDGDDFAREGGGDAGGAGILERGLQKVQGGKDER